MGSNFLQRTVLSFDQPRPSLSMADFIFFQYTSYFGQVRAGPPCVAMSSGNSYHLRPHCTKRTASAITCSRASSEGPLRSADAAVRTMAAVPSAGFPAPPISQARQPCAPCARPAQSRTAAVHAV